MRHICRAMYAIGFWLLKGATWLLSGGIRRCLMRCLGILVALGCVVLVRSVVNGVSESNWWQTRRANIAVDNTIESGDLDTLNYWISNATGVKTQRGVGGTPKGYLITHDTDRLEICLMTGDNRAFVKHKVTGYTAYRDIEPIVCSQMEDYYSLRK